MPAEAFSSLKLCYIVNPTHFLKPDVNYKGHPIWALNRTGAIFILRKEIGVGGWSRKWQFSITLCSENVLI